MTLLEFLLERIKEDEAIARAAVKHSDPKGPRTATWEASNPGEVTHVGDVHHGLAYDVPSQEVAEHIARHDPARVLFEAEAKRQIIAEYHRLVAEHDEIEPDDPRLTLPIMALIWVYRDHPNFNQSWVRPSAPPPLP